MHDLRAPRIFGIAGGHVDGKDGDGVTGYPIQQLLLGYELLKNLRPVADQPLADTIA